MNWRGHACSLYYKGPNFNKINNKELLYKSMRKNPTLQYKTENIPGKEMQKNRLQPPFLELEIQI